MRAAIVSDTHLPRGGRRVPGECVAALRSADAILHAGDLIAEEALDWLRSLGPPLHAVHGNVDTTGVRARLPERLVLELGPHRVGMVHDAGPARGRLERLRREFPGAAAVVFGHSHMPLHEAAAGFQIFNPGSPTERRRAPRRSFGLAHATPGGLRFEHVWL